MFKNIWVALKYISPSHYKAPAVQEHMRVSPACPPQHGGSQRGPWETTVETSEHSDGQPLNLSIWAWALLTKYVINISDRNSRLLLYFSALLIFFTFKN